MKANQLEEVVWRIASNRYPPLSIPPPDLQGGGRFDDPREPGGYSVLYCGIDAHSALVETLARFRLDMDSLQKATSVEPIEMHVRDEYFEDMHSPTGSIPKAWREQRALHQGRLILSSPTIDLTRASEIQLIRQELVSQFLELGLGDVDLSTLTHYRRIVTQQISLWAWQQGYSGIRYVSRFGADLVCFALFSDRYSMVGHAESYPLEPSSPGFAEAASTLRLQIA